MRSALRTFIVTAAVAGTVLVPTAGSALAAPALQAAPAASGSGNDRQAAQPVFIGEGLVAVLSFDSGGPEASIHTAAADWKPGDPYGATAVTVLDGNHRTATANGLRLALVEGEEAHVETLTVTTKDGRTTSHRLPSGKGSECVSAPLEKVIGAGASATLMMTPTGPLAVLKFDEEGPMAPEVTLTRTRPSLPKGALTVRILNPSSAEPVLEWAIPSGDKAFGHAAFPKLPGLEHCTREYALQQPTDKPQPEVRPQAKPDTVPSASPTAAAVAPRTAAQTSVVPKGGVAAGVETAPESDDSASALAAAGLAAALAALAAAVVVRRRARG